MNLPTELIKKILKIKWWTFRKNYLEHNLVEFTPLEETFPGYYIGVFGHYNKVFTLYVFYMNDTQIFYSLEETVGAETNTLIKHFIK